MRSDPHLLVGNKKIYVDQYDMRVFSMFAIDGTEFAEVRVVMMDCSNKQRT
jgi:hypothetical protein